MCMTIPKFFSVNNGNTKVIFETSVKHGAIKDPSLYPPNFIIANSYAKLTFNIPDSMRGNVWLVCIIQSSHYVLSNTEIGYMHVCITTNI